MYPLKVVEVVEAGWYVFVWGEGGIFPVTAS